MPHAWRAAVPLVLLAGPLSGCFGSSPASAAGRQGRARPRRLPGAHSRRRRPAEQRHHDRRVRPSRTPPRPRRRRPAVAVRQRVVRRRRGRRRSPTALLGEVQPSRRRPEPGDAHVLSWAWFRPTEAAWDDGRPVVPLRRRRRRRPEPAATSTCRPRAQGAAARAPEGRVDGVRAGRHGQRLGRRSRAREKHDWRAVTTIMLGDAERRLPR